MFLSNRFIEISVQLELNDISIQVDTKLINYNTTRSINKLFSILINKLFSFKITINYYLLNII